MRAPRSVVVVDELMRGRPRSSPGRGGRARADGGGRRLWSARRAQRWRGAARPGARPPSLAPPADVPEHRRDRGVRAVTAAPPERPRSVTAAVPRLSWARTAVENLHRERAGRRSRLAAWLPS